MRGELAAECLDLCCGRCLPHRRSVDRAHDRDVAQRARREHAIGGEQFVAVEVALDGAFAARAKPIEQQRARHSGEDARVERRRDPNPILHGNHVARRRLGHEALRVEEEAVRCALLLRLGEAEHVVEVVAALHCRVERAPVVAQPVDDPQPHIGRRLRKRSREHDPALGSRRSAQVDAGGRSCPARHHDAHVVLRVPCGTHRVEDAAHHRRVIDRQSQADLCRGVAQAVEVLSPAEQVALTPRSRGRSRRRRCRSSPSLQQHPPSRIRRNAASVRRLRSPLGALPAALPWVA